MTVVPYLLQDILIVIAFFWKPDRLPILVWQLNGFMKYSSFSNITIVVTTNKPENLAFACKHYSMDCSKVEIWDSILVKNNPLDLTFEHRIVIENKLKFKNYTAYMYTEDDHMITPQALVSWAIDTELLEPFGFTRGFLRSEYCGDGQQRLIDFDNPFVSLTNGRPKVDRLYKNTTNGVNFEGLLYRMSDKYGSELCPSTSDHDGSVIYTPCPIHAHFFSPFYPYQAMWTLSHTQLQTFMKHDIWNVTYCQTYTNPLQPWPTREKAASYNLFVNIPYGFDSNSVIPFYHIHNKNRLSRLGTSYHLSANYCYKNHRDHSYIYPANHTYIIHKNHPYFENNSSYNTG